MWWSREALHDPEANKDLVPTFISWLRSGDPKVRSRVAGLGSLGPQARTHFLLETQFERGQPGERIAMAWAMFEIDPVAGDRFSKAIFSLINDPALDRPNRTEAARLIRRYFLWTRTRGLRAETGIGSVQTREPAQIRPAPRAGLIHPTDPRDPFIAGADRLAWPVCSNCTNLTRSPSRCQGCGMFRPSRVLRRSAGDGVPHRTFAASSAAAHRGCRHGPEGR